MTQEPDWFKSAVFYEVLVRSFADADHNGVSGQALTGAAILNAGSLAFMLAVFAAGYAVAWIVARKEWL